MRKIIISNFLSVDGYFASESGGTEWTPEDVARDEYMEHYFQEIDTILFGRKTHEMMSTYWPHSASSDQSPIIRKSMNELEKIVFSEKGDIADWHNSHHASELTKDYIKKLKTQKGKDIIVFGSGTIVEQLARLHAVDEYQLFIVPKLLGNGRHMTQNTPPVDLKLVESREFPSGIIMTRYSTHKRK